MRILLTCTCIEYEPENHTFIYSFEGHNGKLIYNSFSKKAQFMPGDIVAVDIKKLEKEE